MDLLIKCRGVFHGAPLVPIVAENHFAAGFLFQAAQLFVRLGVRSLASFRWHNGYHQILVALHFPQVQDGKPDAVFLFCHWSTPAFTR